MEQILFVRPDISQTIKHFVLKHYTSICYLCAMRSAKFWKIIIQNTRLRALFTKLWNFSKSHMCTGSAAQIFNFFKSVPYLRAMCSLKFRTIIIQNGRLRAIFTSKWNKFCPSGPISHKAFNILFWNITHLFVTSVPCVSEFFWKVKCVREALPKFSIVSKSVCCLGSCSLVKHLFCGGYYCLSDILV